jgi:twitching motility protein PilT
VDSTGQQAGRRAARAAEMSAEQSAGLAASGEYHGLAPAAAPGLAMPAPRHPDGGVLPGQAAAGQPVPAAAPAPPDVRPDREPELKLTDVLVAMLAVGASDLHLAAGSPPLARVDGNLGTLDGFGELTSGGIQRAVYAVLTQKQRERFEADLELDLAYSLPGEGRFRVNLYRQREAVGAAFRRIPYEIKSLEQLGMPPVIAKFASLSRGLVLVTGPTGSGKSTTLAALVDLANRTRHDHILTVEDPIEFLHTHQACLVNQREVGEDTHSFGNALRHALRQDPDILLVGEMRDLETISVALTAAETGHLVLATLHTQDAAQTIDRVIDVFPPHQQQQVRTQLAGALQGVVCQSLCRTASGRGRAAATEVLVATPAIRNMIREGKTHQIYSALQAGAQHGMYTMDQSLADLVRRRVIDRDTGLERAHHPEDLIRLIGQG